MLQRKVKIVNEIVFFRRYDDGMDEKLYYLPFSVFPGIGPKHFTQLLAYFKSAKTVWEASPEELKKAHLGEITTEKFVAFRNAFSIEQYLDQLEKAQVWFVTIGEGDYPALLKEISNPPFVLYGKGNKQLLSMPANLTSTPLLKGEDDREKASFIGIVGTRKVTSYGRQVTEQFTRDLVCAGCTIVSGLALGVDAIAHQTTLDEGGKTIAVLGCGVDVCYPSSNGRIYQQIVEKDGAVVSEYPLHMPPSVGSFPSRNRIIAGLSRVLLVTEGAEDSGALITAKDTRALGRVVFAIPGPITSSLSKGTNLLINQGAKVALRAEDILGELGVEKPKSRQADRAIGKTVEEQRVIDMLLLESMSLDELVRNTKLSVSTVSLCLSSLEMAGVIRESYGRYQLV